MVTGVAGGTGGALAKGFLDDGAVVIAADSDGPGLEQLGGHGLIRHVVDVSDEEQVRRMMAIALERTGRLDVLINNAAIGGVTSNSQWTVQIIDHKPDQSENLIRVNLFGPYNGMKAAIPVMKEQNFGRIINTMSRHAELALPGWSAYGTAKAGLFALMRHAAKRDDGMGHPD